MIRGATHAPHFNTGDTIWLADMSIFDGLNKVWNAWVPEGFAGACGEAKLARPELRSKSSWTQRIADTDR